jgi:hypothetical protein
MSSLNVADVLHRLRGQGSISVAIQKPTFAEICWRCNVVWHSTSERIRSQTKTTNACLILDVHSIANLLDSMAAILKSLPGHRSEFLKFNMSTCSTSVVCLESQCLNTVTRIQKLLRPVAELGRVSDSVCDQLHAYMDELTKQKLDLAIMHEVMALSAYPV